MDYTVNLSGVAIAPIPSLPFSALGGQPGFAANDLDSFLSDTRIAMFSYVRKDGRPNSVPLWYAYRDGVMLFVVSTGSDKHRALERDNRVCVAVQDERPPYRAAIVDGTVELVDLHSDAGLSNDLAVKYFGKLGAAEYAKMVAEEEDETGRTLIRLIPERVKGFDNTNAINTALLGFVRLRNRLPIPRRWL